LTRGALFSVRSTRERGSMPITPAAPLPPPLPQPAPHAVPQVQKVTPVEPAKSVTKGEGSGETGLRKDRRRRKRGGVFDLEA
jgi:hypothetical protein